MSNSDENIPTLPDAVEKRVERLSLNGEEVSVVYRVEGENVTILKATRPGNQEGKNAEKTTGSDQETIKGKSPGNTRTDIELSVSEKEQLQGRLEEKVRTEGAFGQGEKTETVIAEGQKSTSRLDVYDRKISPELFTGIVSPTQPTLSILAGQAGTGKGGLSAHLKNERFAQSGGAVVIDPDRLRKFNPSYANDIRTDSRTAATKAEASDWAREAFSEAVSRQVNIILDGTGSDATKVIAQAKLASVRGYRVEVLAVAANGIDSWQSVIGRHEQGLSRDRSVPGNEPEARFVPKHLHDKQAAGVTDTLGRVESQGAADRVAVYARGQYDRPIYDNQQARFEGTTGAARAYEEERTRPRTPKEVAAREQTRYSATGLMDAREAPARDKADIGRTAYESFSGTADRLTGERRPEISADEYIRSPDARREYTAQAAEQVKAYVAELRQQGIPTERVAKIEAGLQQKLGNPAQAYGIKEGLDLREMRKDAIQTTSIRTVRDYYAKQDRVALDVTKVKKAFGSNISERTPEQVARVGARTSWDRLGQERLADLRNNVGLGYVKPEDQPGQEKRIKKIISDAKDKSVKRDFSRSEKQTTGPRQGVGGGRGAGPSQAMQRYRYVRHHRAQFIL